MLYSGLTGIDEAGDDQQNKRRAYCYSEGLKNKFQQVIGPTNISQKNCLIHARHNLHEKLYFISFSSQTLSIRT